tara:strand:+ start:253 stop:528 length:276 start_codon:yes stop_codon:yes gene_type:complete
MGLPIAIGAGAALRGAGKALGKRVLKKVIKRIKKTPNKAFRQDKTYKLLGPKGMRTRGKIIKGKTNKQKAIQEQKTIKRKFDAKGDRYRGP